MRRAPALEKSIKDISGEDYRVKVLGVVVDRDEARNSALVDDGTGTVQALFPDPEALAGLEEGKLVRVIGKVRVGEGIEIEAEAVQDMSKLDRELYEKVMALSEESGSA